MVNDNKKASRPIKRKPGIQFLLASNRRLSIRKLVKVDKPSQIGIFITVVVAIISMTIGALVTWYVTDHYERMTIRKEKQTLIESVKAQIRQNQSGVLYPFYVYPEKYAGAGGQFPCLQSFAFQDLQKNMTLFAEFDTKLQESLYVYTTYCISSVDHFNDKIRLRNSAILLGDFKLVSGMNGNIFEFYRKYVVPGFDSLSIFIDHRKEDLINK
jgi:hypothetical protein